MQNTRLNTDYFAQSVDYRTGDGARFAAVAAHVRHAVRLATDPDTNEETVIEQIHVELDRETITTAPDYGDRIYLAGDSTPYLYAYKGTHRAISWKATFERKRTTRQGL